jgi:hypothetical protein
MIEIENTTVAAELATPMTCDTQDLGALQGYFMGGTTDNSLPASLQAVCIRPACEIPCLQTAAATSEIKIFVTATRYFLPHGKLPTHFLTEHLMIQRILE